ncbi:MAG: DUF2000 domain-containing protein [Candidatus Levyibacteriota bacterium]
MENVEKKCVIILSEDQPFGLMINTASVLSFTLGNKLGTLAIGQDVYDASQSLHLGIITIPIPVLKTTEKTLREIRIKALEAENMIVSDFTDVAQSCKTYDEFIQKMKDIDERQLRYLGVALYGEKKIINKLTGNLSLIR